MAYRGAPLLGDTLYGAATTATLSDGSVVRAPRVLLHAARLTVPLDGRERTFEAPVPEDMSVGPGVAFESIYA